MLRGLAGRNGPSAGPKALEFGRFADRARFTNTKNATSDRTGSHASPWRPAVTGLATAGGAAAALLLGPAARAAGPTDESVAGAVQLEEVVVHARRREERLQDVPLAVSVVSAAQLHDQAAVLFDGLGRDVPNLRMVSSPQSVSARSAAPSPTPRPSSMRASTGGSIRATRSPGTRRCA
jgi:hypothetical protein